ncbi:MAG: nitrate reductase molybdenum cofactor assembly chaperone [Acidobacteriota bacterium]
MGELGWFKLLFAYPDETYRDRAAACAAVTALAEMRTFANSLAALSTGQIQEAFIQAFDMNPNATLEIGWHLFGEQYERGEFLVNLRGRLRAAEIAECGELPDHLLHILPLMSRMHDEDARAFADKYVLPALAKIETGLPKESPFGALVRGLTQHMGVTVNPNPNVGVV